MSAWLVADEPDGLGLRRVDRGTPQDRVVVHRAPPTAVMAESMAAYLLSGHGFGVAVEPGQRRITFGTPGEGRGVVAYEITHPWRAQCLIKRIR